MQNSDNLIAAVKSTFHLQRDGYNSGVAAGYHAELFAANYRCTTLPVTNNKANILIEQIKNLEIRHR